LPGMMTKKAKILVYGLLAVIRREIQEYPKYQISGNAELANPGSFFFFTAAWLEAKMEYID